MTEERDERVEFVLSIPLDIDKILREEATSRGLTRAAFTRMIVMERLADLLMERVKRQKELGEDKSS